MVAVEFRVLGPLEAKAGETAVVLGGQKQRALLAALLLARGEPASVDALVDQVWGDDPPASAAHSVEVYVSRLRSALEPHGVSLLRRGHAYSLNAPGAGLDLGVFERLCGDAARAAETGDHARASALAGDALALWRGPALVDVALHGQGAAEVERIEERRLSALAVRIDAELALGHHEEVVGELKALVRSHPYREPFAARLMLALYGAGRHAEALEVYETTRAALADDLGLRPGSEIQALAGKIVRHEPELRRAAAFAPPPAVRRGAKRLVMAAGAALALVVVVGATASGIRPAGAASAAHAAKPERVALVLPRDTGGAENVLISFRYWTGSLKLASDVLQQDEREPDAAFGDRVRRSLAGGSFGLVVVVGDGPVARRVARDVRRRPGTFFHFVDASLRELSLRGVRNAAAIRFADEESSHLAGYLGGLVAPRQGSRGVDMVSVVAGIPSTHARRVVDAFAAGARRAIPDVAMRMAYAGPDTALLACERIASDQIDAGADVLLVLPGRCGPSALAVAAIRGVWTISGSQDFVSPGPSVLAATYKEWSVALRTAVEGFVLERLRPGQQEVLSLNDNYAVGLNRVNALVPERIWSAVVHRCTQLRIASL